MKWTGSILGQALKELNKQVMFLILMESRVEKSPNKTAIKDIIKTFGEFRIGLYEVIIHADFIVTMDGDNVL